MRVRETFPESLDLRLWEASPLAALSHERPVLDGHDLGINLDELGSPFVDVV